MKMVGRILLAALIFGGGFGLGSIMISNADGLNDTNQPGSVHDPLVTKSYMDQQVTAAVQQEFANQGAVAEEVQKLIADFKVELANESSRDLIVVELEPGEQLIGTTGTEFIVRTGHAVAIGQQDGIPNLTEGKSIADGARIPLDHLLLFPRDDGRGIKPHADQKTTIFVMARGKFVHLDAAGKPK